MQVAIITPFHHADERWLGQCLTSVATQTAPCTHFLVCDGDEPHQPIPVGVQVIRLPGTHSDFGNTPRAIGSVSAIAQGFDAIAYLDADNWYEPEHVANMNEAHVRTGAAVCSAGRMLYDFEGSLLGPCPEVDGKRFVDASCLYLTRKAFSIISIWYLMARSDVAVGDRRIWSAIKAAKLKTFHDERPTVNFRTRYEAHYRFFGRYPPQGPKQIVPVSLANRLPGLVSHARLTVPPPSPALSTQRISLCMIVRNEEATLARCLVSIKDIVNEIIVVDTGSTDATKKIAASCGAEVYSFPWVDDFAAARNEAVRHANGDWILWLDADEYLDDNSRSGLKRLIASLPDENRVFMMRQVSPAGAAIITVDQPRLFRRQIGVGWRYRVHEQILSALREKGADVVFTDIVVRHVGYEDVCVRRLKTERNLRLLLMDIDEHPEDPFTMFNLGSSFLELGETDKGMVFLERCLEKSKARAATFQPKAFVLLASAKHKLGQLADALRLCRQAKERFPQDSGIRFQEGILHLAVNDSELAQKCFEEILELAPGPCYVGTMTGIRGHLARHELAKIHRAQGLIAVAETQWRAACQLRPGFAPAWLGLAELCLEQKRFADLEDIINQLKNQQSGSPIIAAVQARCCVSRSDYVGAKRLLETAIANAPHLQWLELLLSHVVKQEAGFLAKRATT